MAGIGDRIKEARGSQTQKEFAEKIGVDNTTIASWEIGRREPDIESLKKIADMYGVTLDWLAGRSEFGIEKAKLYNDPGWRAIIDIAINHDIPAELLKPVIATIVAIKNQKHR